MSDLTSSGSRAPQCSVLLVKFRNNKGGGLTTQEDRFDFEKGEPKNIEGWDWFWNLRGVLWEKQETPGIWFGYSREQRVSFIVGDLTILEPEGKKRPTYDFPEHIEQDFITFHMDKEKALDDERNMGRPVRNIFTHQKEDGEIE